MIKVSRQQVAAFRIAQQGLAQPRRSVAEAAVYGVRNTPPESGAVAFAARVAGLTMADISRAVEQDKSLIQVWSVRVAPYFVPKADRISFTRGAAPQGHEELRTYMLGAASRIKEMGLTATELLTRLSEGVQEQLTAQSLTMRELVPSLAKYFPPALHGWFGPEHFSLMSYFVRVVGLEGWLCLTPREGNEPVLARAADWLGSPSPEIDITDSQAELVRRYLRAYGPSTVADFTEWVGLSNTQTQQMWKLIENELVAVEFAGQQHLLESDLQQLITPPPAGGVHLLPAYDSLLSLPDRATLVPSKVHQKEVWRMWSNPGVLLLDGEVVGTWRAQKKGKRLLVVVEPFGPIASAVKDEIIAAGERLAPFRGCKEASVTITG